MSGMKNPNNPGRLRVLRAYRNNPNGTLSELTRAAGMSQTAVNYHLHNLEDEGVITRVYHRRGHKVDPRKRASKKVTAKRSTAGNQFRKNVTKKIDKLAERIELVVKMARNGAKSAGVDVFRSGGTVRLNGVKVG